MRTNHKKRLVTAIASAFLVAALWPLTASGQQAVQDKPQTQERTRMGRMGRDLLNITPEQQKKLQAFREARMKDRTAFRDQMRKIHEDMRGLMKDPNANAAKIDGLIDSMARLRADREKMAFRTRMEWEKIFTPEQLAQVRKFRGAFAGRPGFEGRVGSGFARPWPGRLMGVRGMGMGFRGAWGWRMGQPGWFSHRPFFWRYL
jgi:Spy/CpxP family protein refolding chaperone